MNNIGYSLAAPPSYDIGYGGLDHVIASGEDVEDAKVICCRGGQKKDGGCTFTGALPVPSAWAARTKAPARARLR